VKLVGLGCDSHGVKVFSIKLLKPLTQTGSESLFEWGCVADPYLIPQ